MKKSLYILLFLFLSLASNGQTFIEMMSPEDADVILMQVFDSTDADVIICITKDKREAQEWNCIWMFKNWGFSNFSVFIASDTTQLIMKEEESYSEKEYIIPVDGTVYITSDPSKARYRDNCFRLPGVMRVIKYKNN